MRSAWRLEATWGMNRARTVAVEAARGVARAEAEETLARLVAEERSHREDVEALTEELRSEAAAFARMQGALNIRVHELEMELEGSPPRRLQP